MKNIYLLASLLLFISCRPAFLSPDVKFIKLTGISTKGNNINCDIVLRISNRDKRKISFRITDCLVYSGNSPIGELQQSELITLEGGSHMDGEFHLSLKKQEAIGSVIFGFLSKKLTYTLKGKLTYKYLIFKHSFSFQESFSIDSDKLLR